MNYCPNCGSNLRGDPIYCANCGQKLADASKKGVEQKIIEELNNFEQSFSKISKKLSSDISQSELTGKTNSGAHDEGTTNLSQLKCPKCGSENIQKYTLWKKSNKHSSAGTTKGIGCLVVVLLFIFAPALLFGLGIATVISLPAILGIGVIIAIAYAIQQSYESNRYICLKCEHNFAIKGSQGKSLFN